MKVTFKIIIFFLYSQISISQIIPFQIGKHEQEKIFDRKPDYFKMDWEKETHLKSEQIQIDSDSLDLQNIDFLTDARDHPFLYSVKISTPVCADGECRLMDIRFYWDLLGNYAGFDKIENLPLTKYEHEEFSDADYLKLHQLLQDKNSILGERSIDELVEEPAESSLPEGVDALSGATIAEVKGSTIEGALYSSHVAWRLANGDIREKLKEHTVSMLNEELLHDLLYSDNGDYQFFALKNFDDNMYRKEYNRVSEIFRSSIPLTRKYIIKNLPDFFWDEEELQYKLWEYFPEVDLGTRSLLLDHLECATQSAIEIISERLEVLTQNQLKIYLEFLKQNKKMVDPEVVENLKKTAISNEYAYSYLVQKFLIATNGY